MATLLLLFAACADDAPVLVALHDENNYTFVGDLTVPVVPTASGRDVEIAWPAITQDLQCHDLDPATDVDNVGLVRFGRFDQPEVETGMEADSLLQADVDGYVEVHSDGATSVHLDDMSFFGTAIDVAKEYYDGGGTYLLLLTTGTVTGVGARLVTFLQPTTGSDVTAIQVPDGCGTLDLDVDLDALTPVPFPAVGPWTFDWSAVTTNGQGYVLRNGTIDEITFGYYADLTRADLEADFLDVELIADEMWSYALTGGSDVTLGREEGSDIPDFTRDGLWILALRCNSCYNPAPVFLTVLEPEQEEG